MSVVDQTRTVLEMAAGVYAGTPAADEIAAQLDRLDGPLRVAIAGKVKAGKSTLLNALVGEELAPTDAGECTRIVTWYRDGVTYEVTLYPHEGASRQVPFARDAGAIEVDLGFTGADEVERLVVDWPSRALAQLTLVDTPGIASLSADVSARTTDLLTPDEDRATPADAVLYLLRHLHGSDLDFLESFHDREIAQPTPVNAIGVLSRADEVAVGRLDALESAARIAERYRNDPKVRRLVQTVVPVAGLLAQAGVTLREAEHQALRALADQPEETTAALVLSADRFVNAEVELPLTSFEREHLLQRLGLFGVKLAVELLRGGSCATAGQLSEELVRRSGLVELREVLLSQFASRSGILQARSALLAVEDLARRHPIAGAEKLAAEIERVVAGAHELTELRVLNALRSGAIATTASVAGELERLLGSAGSTPPRRLGLPDTATTTQIREAASEACARWQRRAENPLTPRELSDTARVAVRTCEGILSRDAR